MEGVRTVGNENKSPGQKAYEAFRDRLTKGNKKWEYLGYDRVSMEQKEAWESSAAANRDQILIQMSVEEKECLQAINEAYGKFLKLPGISQTQIEDFVFGIHRCQDQIAFNVASRANPEEWR